MRRVLVVTRAYLSAERISTNAKGREVVNLVPVDGHLYRRIYVCVMSDTFYDFEGDAEPSTIRELSKGYHYYIRKRAHDARRTADRKRIKLYFITVHKTTLYSSLVYDFV